MFVLYLRKQTATYKLVKVYMVDGKMMVFHGLCDIFHDALSTIKSVTLKVVEWISKLFTIWKRDIQDQGKQKCFHSIETTEKLCM